jgi:chromosome segregation ATPase
MAERFQGFSLQEAAKIAAGKVRTPDARSEERISASQIDARRKEAAELDGKIKALRAQLERADGKDAAEQIRQLESELSAAKAEVSDNRDFFSAIRDICRSDKARKNPSVALNEIRTLIQEYMAAPSSADKNN